MAVIVSVIAIFLPAWILNKWIEAIFFFFCHWFIRAQFPDNYHCPTHAMCRLLSCVIFFFGVIIIFPNTISICSTIPFCYFIGWVGSIKKKLLTFENKEFNCDTCTKEELLQQCERLHFSEEDKQLAVKFFIDKTRQRILAEELCIEEKSVQQRKRRMRKILNN